MKFNLPFRKVIILEILIIFSCMISNSIADENYPVFYGIKGGVNAAKSIKIGPDGKFLTRSNIGLFYRHALTKNSNALIHFELLYDKKGESSGYKPLLYYDQFIDITETRENRDYIDVTAVLVRELMRTKNFSPTALIGISAGCLLNANHVVNIANENITTKNKDEYNGYDFGYVFGAGIDFHINKYLVIVDVRYSMGLADIDSRNDASNTNQVLSISLGLGWQDNYIQGTSK